MLTLHHDPDADRLVAALAEVLRDPLDDPLTTEPVAVHSRGLERWLAQRLANVLGTGAGDGTGASDGVCAAVDFPFPGAIIGRALAAVGGVHHDRDPWRADRLAWQLLELLAAEPDLARSTPLAAHLGPQAPADRRFAAVRHLADLYDRYGVHRPAMLRRWAAGEGAVAADGQPLPASHAWQARVWTRLHERLAAVTTSPPERLDAATRALATAPERVDLPSRVSLFGLTALPVSYVEVLAALAEHRDVHLFLLHPSPRLWQRVDAMLAAAPPGRVPTREADPTAGLTRHPLLRAWARDAREMQLVLAASGVTATGPDTASDAAASDAAAPDDRPAVQPQLELDQPPLLHHVQAGIRDDVAPPAPGSRPDPRPTLTADDRSVQVHGCHGRARQVEVLRDLLLHRFSEEPSLTPRDVLVLCPDLEAFAPHLEATFHTALDDGPPPPDDELRPDQLRVRLADRTLRRANPLLEVLADVLALPAGRITASQVLDLAGRPPVRARLHLDDAQLQRLAGWVDELGIRWGLDAEHRSHHGVPTGANTWRAGLDRLLTGVAVADEDARTSGGAVPHDDVEGDDVDLAGRLAELIDRLAAIAEDAATARPIEAWREMLTAAVDGLTATGDDDRWQRLQLAHVLDDLVAAATRPDGTVATEPLSHAEVADLVQRGLDRTAGPVSHRSGDLTVCSMVPMRSVPHRVVVLLGMDDDAFPRTDGRDGDDLTVLRPQVGDRDPRTEDRQLLLDALLAARDGFLVLHSSRDERTNEPRPPAVPVGELLDLVDRTVRPDERSDAASARELVTTQHPLHASDPRNFTDGGLSGPGPFGTDAAALAAAEARRRADRRATRPLLDAPLPPPDGDVIELGELVRTVTSPARALVGDRLGVGLPRDHDAPDDELSVELGGLAGFQVGDRVLAGLLAGHDLERLLHLERGRGGLPPGELAAPAVDELTATVTTLTSLGAELGGLDPAAARAADRDDSVADVEVPLSDGRRVVGAVDDLTGTCLTRMAYSKLAATHRLGAWIRLLALTAADPEPAWHALTLGRARQGAPKGSVVSAAVLTPVGEAGRERQERALALLEQLVRVRDAALCEPIPLAAATSASFAEVHLARRDGRSKANPRTSAARAWTHDRHSRGEAGDPAQRLLRGGVVPFATLLEEPPRDGDPTPGEDAPDHRFGRLALHVWEPLLACEQQVDRGAVEAGTA